MKKTLWTCAGSPEIVSFEGTLPKISFAELCICSARYVRPKPWSRREAQGVEVAPETVLNVAPPSVLTRHCTVGCMVVVGA